MESYIHPSTIFLDLIVADPKTSLPRVSEIPDKTEIESLLYQRTLIPFLNEIKNGDPLKLIQYIVCDVTILLQNRTK
jgi:hypothetical protein